MSSEAQIPARRSLRGYLRLARPANVVTAAADVAAGLVAALAAAPAVPAGAPALVLAGMALYAGGVVMNDVFDAKLDAVERPERPLPSGEASRTAAAALGLGLLASGILAASLAGPISAAVAAAVAVLALAYDAWGKHRSLLGPLNMGACRGFNLLLGVSVVPAALAERWYLALLPIAFVAAITAVSRGEVHGGSRATGALALGLLAAAIAGLGGLALTPGGMAWSLAPFLVWFGWRTVPAFVRAYRTPEPGAIQQAVIAGVMAIVALDAVIAAAYGGLVAGAAVLALMLPAARLRRAFAVT